MARKNIRRRTASLIAISSISAMNVVSASAQTTSSWVNPVNGTWTDATNWSTNPSYPTQDNPIGSSYDAYINAIGSPYTITSNGPITLNSLTLASPNATLQLNNDQLQLASGISLNGGTIVGGLISSTLGQPLSAKGAGYLNNVTINSDWQFNTSATLTLSNSTLTAGHTIHLNSLDGLIIGKGLLSGGGTISLDNTNGSPILEAVGASFTIGSGIHIATTSPNAAIIGVGSSSIINQGTISATIAQDGINIAGLWKNQGVLEIGNNGTANLSGTWTNEGTINVSNSPLFVGSMPTQIGTLNLSSASIGLTGTFTTANMEQLRQLGSPVYVVRRGGNIPGAQINGVLDNTASTISLSATTPIFGLVGGGISGGTITSLDGTALPINVSPGVPGGYLVSVYLDAPISMQSNSRLFLTSSVLGIPLNTSNGEVIVEDMTTSQPITVNTGSFILRSATLGAPAQINSATLTIESTSFNASSITVNGGTLLLASPSSNATGSISLANSALFVGYFTPIPNLTMTNTTVYFTGTLDNTNKTTDFGVTPLGSMGWNNNANITGGTIVSSVGPIRIDGGVELENATLAADAIISAQGALGSSLSGITLDHSTVTDNGVLFASGQPIDGIGTIIMTGGKLFAGTLSSNITLESHGGTIENTGLPPLVNNGTIIATEGTTLFSGLLNDGTIIVMNGAQFRTSSVLNNVSNQMLTGGHYIIRDGSTFSPGGTNVRDNVADIILDGPRATFTNLFLRSNSGSFTVTNGKLLSIGSFTNTGVVHIGPMSALKSSSLNNSATIDLSGSMIVDYSSDPSPVDDIRSQIISGRNGGDWSGIGINSAAAAADPHLAVGYASSTQIFGTFPSTFAGFSFDSTAVLLRLTLAGDADLNGAVDKTDLMNLAAHWNTSGDDWSDGDFNYDGSVNVADLEILAENWGQTLDLPADAPALAPLLTSLGLPDVPEPSGIGVIILGGLLLKRHRIAASR